MNNIELNDALIIGKGGERICYSHPLNSKKVIKIVHVLNSHNNQNELEHSYMKYLDKKDVDLSGVTQCYGFVNTNKGKGLIFERVTDYDGKFSNSFRYMIAYKLISEQEQRKLLKDLRIYLEKNKILFIDNSLTNIFYKRENKNESSLIIVDGLGAKRMGLKFYFL